MNLNKWTIGLIALGLVALASALRAEERYDPDSIGLSATVADKIFARPSDNPDYVHLPFEGRHIFYSDRSFNGVPINTDHYHLELYHFDCFHGSINWVVEGRSQISSNGAENPPTWLTGISISCAF